jgi:hypothetical protein
MASAAPTPAPTPSQASAQQLLPPTAREPLPINVSTKNNGAGITASARFVGAIDQGTSSTRFILFDHEGRIVRTAQRELTQIHEPGKSGSDHSHGTGAVGFGVHRRLLGTMAS